MANELVQLTRNTGTEQAPVLEKWFPIVTAEAVKMSDKDGETKNILDHITAEINKIVGGASVAFDTFKEIEDYISSHQEVADALDAAMINKVDKVEGKGLSTNDYTNEEKQKVADAVAGLLYTNNTPVVQAHGGVAAGATFDNVPITQVLDQILYPWVAPVIGGLEHGGAALANKVYEKGYTLNLASKALTVAVTKKSSAIIAVVLSGGTDISSRVDTDISNGGTVTFPLTDPTNVTNDVSLEVKVRDAANRYTTANTNLYFVYPYYMGVVAANASITETLVKGLTKKIVRKGNQTNAYTAANQKMVFAYPAAYGNLKTIIDPNNFDVTGTFTKQTVNITGLDGTSQAYNVYVNDASTVSNFNMKFNY